MSSNISTQHVAVIGGGIMGVSTAVHLLRLGASVTLVTEAELCSGATGRSLSWLNSAGERSGPYHALRMAGIDRYRTLFASDPSRDWLQFDGGLFWSTAENYDDVNTRHSYEVSHGYASQLIGSDEISAVTPHIDASRTPGVAVFNPGEGWVSLPHLVEFLMNEFHARGGDLVTHAGKAQVLVEEGRATGVSTLAGGNYSADAVVVACGPQTSAVVAELGINIPDASPVSMVVLTEPAEQLPKSVLNTPRAAIRPNPGNTLAIDHDWYEDELIEDADGSYSVDETVVRKLVEEASKLIDGTPQLQPASWKIGRKPIPGDGEPVFGELKPIRSCYVAYTHSGATLGLIGGELLADEIQSGRKHPMLSTFSPERFNS